MTQTNLVICPSCGHANIEGSDECENCHMDLRTMDIPETMQPANNSDLTLSLGTTRLSKPVTVDVETSIRDAIKLMKKTSSGALVVMRGDQIAGMFTERDVLQRVAAGGVPVERSVSEVMTPDPVILRDTDTVAVALNKMGVGGFRHIPLTHDGELVAMVSVRDVLQWLLGRYLD
jgi:CBS domain-containing protein